MAQTEYCGIVKHPLLASEAAPWRVAESLDKLLDQINKAAPKRSKLSDGSIGDADHQNSNSDHNPWCGPGVVTARDVTHDPKAGADMHKVTEAIRKSKDPRVKYVIYNRRIFSATVQPWTWRAYTGSNPHTLHTHISVNCDTTKDSTKAWSIATAKPRTKWRVTATKTRDITGGKRARAWAKIMRGRKFRVEIKEL